MSIPIIISLLSAACALLAAIATWVLSRDRAEPNPATLTNGQRWEVAKIVAAIVAGFVALLGLGVDSILREAAGAYSRGLGVEQYVQIAKILGVDQTFQKSVATVAPSLPAGTVLAFDLDDETGGCPDDWALFQKAAGRFLLAAGDGKGLTPRPAGKIGGQESVTLSEQQMPKHNHSMKLDRTTVQPVDSGPIATVVKLIKAGDDGDQGYTTPSKEATAHENMPPFIALTFCKKL